MKSIKAVLFVMVLTLASGCSHYSDITGKVVDNTSGKPVEGAVVIAQWTNTRGIPGLQYHNLHKIVETLTDKNGAFSLKGTFGFIINPPEMIIYKEGYIPWRNDSIFPSCDLVKSNEWINKSLYKLEVFSDKYTSRQLWEFMDYGIIGLGNAPIFYRIHGKISDRKIDEDKRNKI